MLVRSDGIEPPFYNKRLENLMSNIGYKALRWAQFYILSSRDTFLTRPFKLAYAEVAWVRFQRKYGACISQMAGPRVFYFIVPPNRLKNLGDHAQRLAIHQWIGEHVPEAPIIDVTKDEVMLILDKIRPFVREEDHLLLHSGGNLGDNGMWSERARRKVIEVFRSQRMLSLPQTIWFSDTFNGRKEKAMTRFFVEENKGLTLYARDCKSWEFAASAFPNVRIGCAPDFVLRYASAVEGNATGNGRILACLRLDEESVLSKDDHHVLLNTVFSAPTDHFDTTLPIEQPVADWRRAVDDTLAMFAQYDAVLTDRFHGLIFAVLMKRPVVVLGTHNHKLSSAMGWFEQIEFVQYAESIEEVSAKMEVAMGAKDWSVPDWNKLYFNQMATWFSGVDAPVSTCV